MSAAPTKRFGAAALGFWAVAFVLARGALALALADVFFYGEELAKGAAAKALLDGLPLAHWQLAYHPYEGGGFVTSHLDALAFALVGPSLLAQKLVALAFGVVILAAGARFAARWFGPASAHVFCGLYVLAPASVQKLGLLNLGIHYQALCFSIVILHLALRLAAEPEARARTWLAFGGASGFGFYFSYSCALAIAPAVAWVAWRARGRLAARAGWAALGAALGLAPLAYMAWHVGWAVFDIHGTEVVGGESEPRTELLAAFAASIFAGRDAWDLAGVLALPLAALAGAAAARGAPGGARTATALVLALLALFVASYLGSGFAVGEVYHYFRLNRLCPAWLACALLAAAGFAGAEGRARSAARAVLALAVALALAAGAGDLVRETRAGAGGTLGERWELLVRSKGYDYRDWLGKVLPRTALAPQERARVALAFDEPARDWLAAAAGEQVWIDSGAALDEAIAEARSVDPSGRLLLGFGVVLKRKLGGELGPRLEALRSRPAEERALLEEAAGRFGTRFVASEDVLRAELAELRGLETSEAFRRGFGWRLFGALGASAAGGEPYWRPARPPLWASRERARELVAREDPGFARAVLAGYEEARAAHMLAE